MNASRTVGAPRRGARPGQSEAQTAQRVPVRQDAPLVPAPDMALRNEARVDGSCDDGRAIAWAAAADPRTPPMDPDACSPGLRDHGSATPPIIPGVETSAAHLAPGPEAGMAAMPAGDDARLFADHLQSRGQAPRDEAECRRALDIDPMRLDALLGLAMALLRKGDHESAQLILLRSCGVAPGCAACWYGLGLALMGTREHGQAEAAFARAQALEPQSFELALRRSGAALLAGTAELELARLEVVTAQDPLDVVALTARGVLLDRLGHGPEAAEILEVATILAPCAAEPAIELANTLLHADDDVAAERALSHAIALRPDQWLLRNNRAVILMRLHRFAEARTELEALAAQHEAQPGVLCNLSTALTALGEQEASVSAARNAIALSGRLHLARRALLNALAYRDGIDGATMLRAARDASACIDRAGAAASVAAAPTSMPDHRRDPARRLRIGLLSTMLKTHPVGWLTVAGIENLDPRAFEVVCIAQPESGDPIARRFRAVASEWHPIGNGDAAPLAARIGSLEIDVLLELSGYGDRGVMSACAHRAAPVQVKWVGMQNHSTGLPEMDWFLTDRWETPDGFERFYSERLLRMPDGYVCYSPPTYAPEVAPSPALSSGRLTFGCFNNLAKITPAVVATWSRILRACPESRLVLKTHQFSADACRSPLLARFAAHGIDPARVELRAGSQHRELLRQYGDIDIVLDPFPYTGGLTTCEALWMGVPTVTLAGETFSSRHAISHMSNVGLADWAASDVDGYVDVALAQAGRRGDLAALRAGMRARMRESPLCDGPRFGRNLGAALRHAWNAWCAA